jgi:hypothetical protein
MALEGFNVLGMKIRCNDSHTSTPSRSPYLLPSLYSSGVHEHSCAQRVGKEDLTVILYYLNEMEFPWHPCVFYCISLCLPDGGKQDVCIRCDLYFIDFSICQLVRHSSLPPFSHFSRSFYVQSALLGLASGFRTTSSEARYRGNCLRCVEGGREGDAL